MSDNQRINRGQQGVDLSSEHARLVEMPNAIPARYDRGITKHKFEVTGVLEVIHLGKKEDIWKQEELVDYGTEKLNIKPEASGTV